MSKTGQTPLHGRRDTVILLVEDDRIFRGLLARALVLHGYVVRQVASSEEATREVALGLRPDLVLLDVNLPGETGWGLLRGTWLADAGSPPVIVVSGTTLQPARLAESGVSGYLPKPFPLETLLEIVERARVDGRPVDTIA